MGELFIVVQTRRVFDPEAAALRLAASPAASRSPHPSGDACRPRCRPRGLAGLGPPVRRRRSARAGRRRPVEPSGRSRDARPSGQAHRRRHRYRIRQVARLSLAGPVQHRREHAEAGRPRRHSPLRLPDQGARPRPACRHVSPCRPGSASDDLRRRLVEGRARLGAQPCQLRAHESRHAAPLDAAGPCPLGDVLGILAVSS